MDPTIAAAAATAVARYGATCQSKSPALKSRIHGVIHDYVGSFSTPKNDITFDLHRRFFRLQTLAASASDVDEAMLATTQWKQVEYHRHELQTRADEVTQYQQQINQLNERIQTLMAEKREVQLSVKSQAVLFQRQLNKCKSAARMEASRLVEHHGEERSKAEHRVVDAMRRIKMAESKQEEAEQRATASKDSERKANNEVHTERSKVLDVERKLKEKEASDQKKANEVAQLRLKVEDAQMQVSEKADQVATVEKQLDEKDSQLQHASQAHGELQEELESAYEKLVTLAQIYEIKEEETEETSRKMDRDVRNSRRKLEHEIRRNEELEEDNTKLQRDSERLGKKLERAKERLQNELQDRADEKERRKRTGPISYINQLHTSTNESQRSSTMSAKDRSRLFAGKENSLYSSSSSRSKGRSFSER
jgi:myosin protein heavy chain